MNNRIKRVRLESGLNMDKFGEKLGVSKSAVSQWESGANKISDMMIKSICREFDINEEWLRDGIEPMRLPADSFSLDDFIKSKGATGLELELIKTYFELDPQIRQTVISHFQNRLTASMRDADSAVYDSVPDDPKPDTKKEVG